MKHILIVEDEQLMRDLLYEYFIQADYKVSLASDGVEALNAFRNETIDLVVLDIMMPKLDGFSVCRKIRKESDALIIMLTAREDEDDKLLGYELGTDDYMTKPFSPKVLLAKVKILLERFDQEKSISKDIIEEITIGDMIIDIKGYKVILEGKLLNLTNKEFELLLLLAKNKGKVIGRPQILNSVWGADYYGDGRVLNTNIKTLRKKLGGYSHMVKTVINIGYKLEVV